MLFSFVTDFQSALNMFFRGQKLTKFSLKILISRFSCIIVHYKFIILINFAITLYLQLCKLYGSHCMNHALKVHSGSSKKIIYEKHLYECKQLVIVSCRHSFEYLDRNIFHQTDHLQTPSDFENKNSSDKNLFASEFDLLLLLVDGRNICLMVLFIFQKSLHWTSTKKSTKTQRWCSLVIFTCQQHRCDQDKTPFSGLKVAFVSSKTIESISLLSSKLFPLYKTYVQFYEG